ncbi:hypothetical protein B0H16DRAFT_1697218 [Mycena metata]|uniref:Uncharacterized protein n=1 Tax=Mycena metata TaxID=1033252 RepID=A0AAD7MR22_9AGAR|nr:hypothetical protein B0H16DRAFT_1697218 [Mycena metata]
MFSHHGANPWRALTAMKFQNDVFPRDWIFEEGEAIGPPSSFRGPVATISTLRHARTRHEAAPSQWEHVKSLALCFRRTKHNLLLPKALLSAEVVTILLDGRLPNDNNIIPESENGFSKTIGPTVTTTLFSPLLGGGGKFSLRSSATRPTAFPYTHIRRLWADMYAAGISGPFFDSMRMLYACMRYAVKFGDEHSLSSAICRRYSQYILRTVELVWEFKYNVLARHYAVKASKAWAISNALFTLKHKIETLHVREG